MLNTFVYGVPKHVFYPGKLLPMIERLQYKFRCTHIPQLVTIFYLSFNPLCSINNFKDVSYEIQSIQDFHTFSGRKLRSLLPGEVGLKLIIQRKSQNQSMLQLHPSNKRVQNSYHLRNMCEPKFLLQSFDHWWKFPKIKNKFRNPIHTGI